MAQIATTARGVARLASPEDLAKEDALTYLLATDTGSEIITDSGVFIRMNVPDFGYTHPNLHRRIDNDPVIEPGSNYPFVHYNEDGDPYPQTVVLGVWDGLNSYRTTTTYTHDEESDTCEIP